LEHTRVYYFANGGAPDVYIGSADWMSRNLEDRVEAIVHVKDEALRDRIITILDRALGDSRSAWELGPTGQYIQRVPSTPDAPGLQEQLMEDAERRLRTTPT
jgi:polyphosphate kinase